MRCTPNTSCSPAATRNRTEAWKTPPIRTSKNEVKGGRRSELDVRRLDPLPEIAPLGLLQLIGVHLRDVADGREVEAVLVRGHALVERLLGDVVLPHVARAAERLDLDAFHGVDDVVLRRPGVLRLVGGLDAGAIYLHREVGAVRFPVRVVLVL